MRKTKRMLSLLLAVLMALSALSLSAFAAGGTLAAGRSVNGLMMDKQYDAERGLLTLEAYVTGESQTQILTQPVDIALVLDVSGSMEELTAHEMYSFAYQYNDSFIEVGARGDLSELDSVYGGGEGVYLLNAYTGIITGQALTKMRYQGGSWQYLGEGSTWKNVDRSSLGSGKIYISKLNALKLAAEKFIDAAAAASYNNSDDPSRISVVKFAGDKKNETGNDRYSSRNTSTGWSNYSQIVRALTPVTTGMDALKSAVLSLQASGATRADYGMQLAQTALAAQAGHTDHKQVVILFTDGAPTSSNSFESAVANAAISASRTLKNSGATVYTVGCFSATPGNQIANYMNYTSSNYPQADSMRQPGRKAADRYYLTAGTSAALNDIFQTISQEIGGATITLGAETVLQDVVSEYFELPENADSRIRAYSMTCTALDPVTGKPTAWVSAEGDRDYPVERDGKTLRVTGFDYSANWVGSHSGVPGGRKLVVEIPIERNMDTCWGVNLPTNGEGSGIWSEGKEIAPFITPVVDFPYYYVANVQDGMVVKTTRYEGYQVTLTDKVSENYLYGGGFTDEACTVPSGNGKTGFRTVGNGEIYYIWEVPTTYLLPKSASIWEHKASGELDVMGFYLMSVIDRLYYQSVGFDASASNGASGGIGDVGEKAPALLKDGTVYESMEVSFKNGTSQTMQPGDPVFGSLKGYLACFDVPAAYWQSAGDTVTFTPYWVTLDGVKVTGTTTRTCRYEGPGTEERHKRIGKTGETETGSEMTAAARPADLHLNSLAAYCADGSQYEMSVLPADSVKLTVHDNGTVRVLDASKGDLTGQVPYAGGSALRFAGWYTDVACTKAADFRNVQTDMELYAKYAESDCLTLRYACRGLFRATSVTLRAAVDAGSYAELGFVIDGRAVPAVCQDRASLRLGSEAARRIFDGCQRQMTCELSLAGLRTGDQITVTPYWITLDGTTVYGPARTLTYVGSGLRG